MIVKCEKCQTRFRLPDEKVTEAGVKLRCTKCRHTFKVKKGAVQAELGSGGVVAQVTNDFNLGAGEGGDTLEKTRLGSPGPDLARLAGFSGAVVAPSVE